jgi:thioredoxin reductase (NADPH)
VRPGLHDRHGQPRLPAASTGDVPILTAEENGKVGRYCKLTWYSDGERLVETGKVGPGMIVVLFGLVAITERDGLGHATPVAEQDSSPKSARVVC